MVLSSVFFTPLCSSVNRGSTRVCSLISFWSAEAARTRTSRLGSFRALMNVVWSWGRKGFNIAPTCEGKQGRYSWFTSCFSIIELEAIKTANQTKCLSNDNQWEFQGISWRARENAREQILLSYWFCFWLGEKVSWVLMFCPPITSCKRNCNKLF